MMKRFLAYICIFFGLIILIDIGVGFVARYLNSHAKGGDTANHYYIANEMTDSVLVFGSSRAIHHFNPRILEQTLGTTAYNCGVDGNGILYNYGRLLTITRRYTPKMIIYDVLPSFDMQDDDDSKYLSWQRRWYDVPGVSEIFYDISHLEKYKMISQMYRYNRSIIQMLSDNLNPRQEIDYKGFKPLHETMTEVSSNLEADKPIQ